jgi:phosphate/sulfate permease
LHPIAKIIVGAIMIIGSVYAVVKYPEWGLLSAFITVVKGVVPVLVFLIGLFIVWLELDELRIEKELKTEERKVRKK